MKGKNKESNLKRIILVLLIILISMISFGGLYNKDGLSNIIPEYIKGSDIEGYRIVKLKIDESTNDIIKDSEGNTIESATDEEIQEKGYKKEAVPVNSKDSLNQENYIKTKEIISNRLRDLKVSDYKVRQDLDDGSIILELKENMSTDTIISNMISQGKFELQSDETKEVLLKNDDIKTANVLYNTTATGTTIYLNIEFNKEATKKLEEISKTYVSSTDAEGKTTDKKINILIDDSSILNTTFGTPIIDGKLQLSIGSSSGKAETTNTSDLSKYIQQAQNMSTILKSGKLPLKYTTNSNKYVKAPIEESIIKVIIIVSAIIIGIMLLALIIMFKGRGILAVISHIGLNAILLLLVRYTNVEIGLGGLIALLLVQVLNYILLIMMLKENNTNETKKAIVKFAYRIIPAYIISIVFTFMDFLPIYSFGMVIFWAITVIFIYNIFITSNFIESSKE